LVQFLFVRVLFCLFALVSGSCAESLCLFASPNLCCSSPAAKRGRTRKDVHGPLGRAKSIQMVGWRSDLRREANTARSCGTAQKPLVKLI